MQLYRVYIEKNVDAVALFNFWQALLYQCYCKMHLKLTVDRMLISYNNRCAVDLHQLNTQNASLVTHTLCTNVNKWRILHWIVYQIMKYLPAAACLGHQNCTKFVLGRGCPGPRWRSLRWSPNPLVGWGGNIPLQTSPLYTFGVSAWRLRCLVCPVPFFLTPTAPRQISWLCPWLKAQF